MHENFVNIVDYSQPDFHHFAQDSIEFVHWIKQNISLNESPKCLDLCSGCGVIGLEVLQHCSAALSMDFCEIQAEFSSHFLKNRNFLHSQGLLIKGEFYQCDFRELPENKYDYIFSNPPYFSLEKGKSAPSPQKNLCRFFSSQDWKDYFVTLERLLSREGKAFFLAREIHWERDERIRPLFRISGSQIFCFDLNIK